LKIANLDLKNLKEITLTHTAGNSKVTKILNNVQQLEKVTLDTVDILGWSQVLDKHYFSWLLKQEHLKELSIGRHALKFFFKKILTARVEFQLKKLSIVEHLQKIPQNKETKFKSNLCEFLKTQTEIEEVFIWTGSDSSDPRFWHEIFVQLLRSKILKNLTIHKEVLPAVERSFINENLESLSIDCSYRWLNLSPSNWQTLKTENLDILRRTLDSRYQENEENKVKKVTHM
jgi:hypothetical protein